MILLLVILYLLNHQRESALVSSKIQDVDDPLCHRHFVTAEKGKFGSFRGSCQCRVVYAAAKLDRTGLGARKQVHFLCCE
jgi:hypothetical protein